MTDVSNNKVAVQPPMNPYANLNMTDLFVNNFLLSKFGEVLNGNYKLNAANIAKLMVLTNLSGMKKTP